MTLNIYVHTHRSTFSSVSVLFGTIREGGRKDCLLPYTVVGIFQGGKKNCDGEENHKKFTHEC